MKTKKKTSTNPNNKKFIKCVMFAYGLYIIFFVAVSFIVLLFDLDSNKYYYISITQLAVCSFISAFNCGLRLMKNGMIAGLLCALPLILTVFLISVVTNGFKIDFSALISFAIAAISAMLGGVISVNTNIKPKR